MEIILNEALPPYPAFVEGIRWALDRDYTLDPAQTATASKSAPRYVPKELYETLAPESIEELRTRGRIYGYRYHPQGDLRAKPIDECRGCCIEGRAFQVMIDNNLCFDITLYPHELVTYSETGQACQNWMQYRLIKQYLEALTCDQTLVIEGGHPLGFFKSKPEASRVITASAIIVRLYDNQRDQRTAMRMGVASCGQMTASGWIYIGLQGIVYGAFNALLNAGQLKLGIPRDSDLRGRLFVSSGLGGVSGAQLKATEMSGAATIIAEMDTSRIDARHHRGWVGHMTDSLPQALSLARKATDSRTPISIAYHDNVVDPLEYAIEEQVHIDLLSDQTSYYAVYDGGYRPAGLTFEEHVRMLHENPAEFRHKVDATLKRHFLAIEEFVERGTYFFDYDNSFMKVVYDAGVTEIARNGSDKNGFILPNCAEDIMGPELFDYGYEPFYWVCLSGRYKDLVKTNQAAMEYIGPTRRGQDLDNYNQIHDAEKNSLVMGTQARILYQDAEGRMKVALRFNEMVRRGEVDPVMLGRNHHDVSGTDSLFRETSNIKDGNNVMADMTIQCSTDNCARDMSLVVLHSGGGVGIGKAINGGSDMMCSGPERVDEILRSAVLWDIVDDMVRRSWIRSEHAMGTSEEFNRTRSDGYHITIPYMADEELIDRYIKQ